MSISLKIATIVACALLVSSLAHASKDSKQKRVNYSAVEKILDLYQGESKCVDLLESKYGDDAIIVDGKNEYTILNLCDFE